MTGSTLVTAIIPSYNHERYIGAAIRGLLEQTYQNIQLIIIDDGSSDGSRGVIQALVPECEAHFVGFSYLQQGNAGLATTMNQALELARGDYVLLNGSDDIAEPEAVATLAAALDAEPFLGLVACDNYFVDSDGQRVYWGDEPVNLYDIADAKYTTYGQWMQKHNDHVELSGPEFGRYEHLLLGNHIPNGYLMRKSVLVEAGGYDPKIALEDWPTHLRLARLSGMKYVDEPLFNYRWHSSNTIHHKEFSWRIPRQILLREKEYALANGYAERWEKAFCWYSYPDVLRRFRKWLISVHTGRKKRRLRLFGIDIISPPKSS
ncbi:MAG: glycosyltransferase [Gammaproteobacteria bacterium]|nr:glycosyltransferase [Gammaproteobacteria bacterium]